MIVAMFEDDAFENFLPLTYTRPVFKLKTGILSFLERAQVVFPKYPFLLLSRSHLIPTLKQQETHPINDPDVIDDLVLINGTFVIEKQTREDIELLKTLFKLTVKERRNAGVAKRAFML